MMFAFRIGVAGSLLLAVGCNLPPERLNAPPQGSTDYPCKTQEPFAYMVDNAMLEDLSLADIHFVPHTAYLNGLGVRRLERYAKLLTVYGGSIRYSTSLTDSPMVERRMGNIRAYLATTGIPEGRVKVAQGIPGGKGMSAKEAVASKAVNVPTDAKAAGRSGGVMGALSGIFGGGK
jgi:hypothetical protein